MVYRIKNKQKQKMLAWGIWLAPSIKRVTLTLRVARSSPMVGMEHT